MEETMRRLILLIPILLGLRCDVDSWQQAKLWIPDHSEIRLVGKDTRSLGVFNGWSCITGAKLLLEQAVACHVSEPLCSGKARPPGPDDFGRAWTCIETYEVMDLLVTSSVL
jgi:hypothetical protein